jgi:hypothetical protein
MGLIIKISPIKLLGSRIIANSSSGRRRRKALYSLRIWLWHLPPLNFHSPSLRVRNCNPQTHRSQSHCHRFPIFLGHLYLEKSARILLSNSFIGKRRPDLELARILPPNSFIGLILIISPIILYFFFVIWFFGWPCLLETCCWCWWDEGWTSRTAC